MKNVWKLSNYLFLWQWKKWNKGVMLAVFLLGLANLAALAIPMGNPISYEYYPKAFQTYDMALDGSMIPVCFVIGLGMLLIGVSAQLRGFSQHGKGIYTLFLLPMKRKEVYLAFLFSALASILLYYMLWLILLVAAYFPITAIYENKAVEEVFILAKDNMITGIEVQQTNGLFLAFRHSTFLATCFPSTFGTLLSAIGGVGLMLTGLLFAGFYTEEIGVRVLGSAGAILLGGYIYLYEAAARLIAQFGTEASLGGSFIKGVLAVALMLLLQKYTIKRLDRRTDY